MVHQYLIHISFVKYDILKYIPFLSIGTRMDCGNINRKLLGINRNNYVCDNADLLTITILQGAISLYMAVCNSMHEHNKKLKKCILYNYNIEVIVDVFRNVLKLNLCINLILL
jgi:hypothetical protein